MPSIDIGLIGDEILVLAVGLVLWWIGYRAHQFVSVEAVGAIRLPRVIGLLFGSYRADGILSVSGIVSQILSYALFVGALARADLLPQQVFNFAELAAVVSIPLASLVLAFNYLRGKRKMP